MDIAADPYTRGVKSGIPRCGQGSASLASSTGARGKASSLAYRKNHDPQQCRAEMETAFHMIVSRYPIHSGCRAVPSNCTEVLKRSKLPLIAASRVFRDERGDLLLR